MNVRLRMYQVLFFKFRRHLRKGSIFSYKSNLFPYERFRMETRFETEVRFVCLDNINSVSN